MVKVRWEITNSRAGRVSGEPRRYLGESDRRGAGRRAAGPEADADLPRRVAGDGEAVGRDGGRARATGGGYL